MIISLDNVTKSVGERILFKGVSFQVNPRQRWALLGPNGAGKSTLLEIMLGERSSDEGTITTAKGVTIGYLRQEAIEMAGATVLEEVSKSSPEPML